MLGCKSLSGPKQTLVYPIHFPEARFYLFWLEIEVGFPYGTMNVWVQILVQSKMLFNLHNKIGKILEHISY